MKVLKTIAKGSIYSIIGSASNYLLSYLFLFVAARLLGAGPIGAYFWCLSIVSVLSEIARLGMGQGLNYMVPKIEVRDGENKSVPLLKFAILTAFFLAILLGIILFILAPLIADLLNKPRLGLLLRVFSVASPAGVIWPLFYRYLVARFRVKTAVLYGDIARPLLRLMLVVFFALLGFKTFSLPLSEIFVGLILIIASMIIISKYDWRDGMSSDAGAAVKREMLLYSLPLLPITLFAGNKIIIIILGLFVNVVRIGVFTVALKLASLSVFFLAAINFVFRPMLAKLFEENNKEMLQGLFKSSTRWIFAGTLPISFLLIMYPASFMLLFGKKFEEGAAALAIISFGYLFDYATSSTQALIVMSGRSMMTLMNQICSFVVITLLAFFLVPSYGINGAAWAVATGLISINLIRLYQAYRIVGCTPFSWYLIKPIVAIVAAGFSIWLLFPVDHVYHLWQLIMLITVFIAIYGFLIILLGINNEDKTLLFAARDRLLRTISQ